MNTSQTALPLSCLIYLPPCSEVFDQLVASGMIVPQPEKSPPTVPMDYKWAQELGLIRKPAAFMSSICDERGEELLYAGTPISNVFKVCLSGLSLYVAQVHACFHIYHSVVT